MEAVNRKVAVALLQEPYVGGAGEMRSRQGVRLYQNTNREEGTVKAVVAVFDENLRVKPHPNLATNNFVLLGIQAETWKVTLVSFYFEPEAPI